ncbi:hypothetical protein BH23BAC2_BH23BAC2_04320 [soil metagenome]
MKKPLIPFLTILMLLHYNLLQGQQITFNKVVPPTGNSHGMVSGFAQDKNGFMWITTKGGLL